MIIAPEVLLTLPLGKPLATDNWENHVHELGNDWVYKEVKTEHDLSPETEHYHERYTLQRYWCSKIRYQNLVADTHVIRDALVEWFPTTHILRTQGLVSGNPESTTTIQQRIPGTLLSELPEYTSDSLERLRAAVFDLARNHFNAPMDFHPGNVLVDEAHERVWFFDPAAPSDWQYYLNREKLRTAINIADADAERFIAFMQSIYPHHAKNCGMG